MTIDLNDAIDLFCDSAIAEQEHENEMRLMQPRQFFVRKDSDSKNLHLAAGSR